MSKRKYKLDDYEKVLIKYIAEGMTNKEIAEKLHISFHTVKSHLSALYKKINVQNRCCATHVATKYNLTKISE